MQFIGTYNRTPLPKDDQSNLYLGADNTLYYPNADGFSIGAFLAYFHIDLDNQMAPNRIVMNFGDNETTGMISIDVPSSHEAEIWYTLDGRQLNGKPTASSIYINNGRKVLITTK